MENILRGAPGLSLLEPPPDAAKREGGGGGGAAAEGGADGDGDRLRRASGIKTLALGIWISSALRWDLGRKRIKRGRGGEYSWQTSEIDGLDWFGPGLVGTAGDGSNENVILSNDGSEQVWIYFFIDKN